MIDNPQTLDPTPETARALLYRYGLPEDVIDGALCLHAQELAAAIRNHPGAIPYRPQLDEDGGFWWDLHDRDAAADLIDPARADAPAVLSAVPVPPATHATDRAERRTRYAAAMAVRDGDTWPTEYESDEGDYLRRADAVIAVADAEQVELRAEVEQLNEVSRRLLEQRQEMAEERYAWQERGDRAEAELRRMADEAQQQPETETRDSLMRDQAILARVRRLYESGPLGTCCSHLVGAALSGPGRVADEVQPETVEVVHGCPPDGSGLTPCCGRTPFELPLGDRISSEAPTTCQGVGRG